MSEKKNSLVTAQLYRNLSSGSPERFNQSFRFILENVEKKSLRDPMILQLRTMIQEQLLGFHLTQEDFVSQLVMRDYIRNLLDCIPSEIQRRRIALHYLCGFSAVEIAKMENVSSQAVDKSIHAGLNFLKKI